MRLVRLVKVHYLVPQQEQPDSVQCLQLMEQHLKVQMVVLDRRDQEHNRDLKPVVLDRQIMDPDPQQVTQVHSDEASLTSQPHQLVGRRDLQQIMLMEVPLKHLRYSVVSLQHHPLVDRRDQVDNKDQQVEHKDQQVEHKDQQVEHSRDQAHLMVLHQ